MIKYLRLLRATVFDAIDHSIIFERMRRMGFTPDVDFRNEFEATMRSDTLVSPNDPDAFYRAIFMFFKANLEANDPAFIRRIQEWYLSKGREVQTKIGSYFVRVFTQGKVDTPDGYAEVLKGIFQINAPKVARYEFKGWKTDGYPRFKLKSVTFEVIRIFPSQ